MKPKITLRIIIIMALISTATIASGTLLQQQSANASVISSTSRIFNGASQMATSGNNIYVVWWTNKSGDWEVMFKASTDDGKTFGPIINLSNSSGVVSDNSSIAASGNNVYVSWWERTNQTSNEPVIKVSNDNGKTFGEKIMLSNNVTTTAKPLL
jgi:hypothetical protein